MPSAAFSIEGLTGSPVSVSAGATVHLALLSSTGVNTIEWSINSGSESGTTAPTITSAGSPLGATATFTMTTPASSDVGISWIVTCVINGGVDAVGRSIESYTQTGIVGVDNANSKLPFAYGEALERDANVGIVADLNEQIATGGGGGASLPTGIAADFLIHTGVDWDNLKTATQNSLGSAVTFGLSFSNTTAASGGTPSQNSPSQCWIGTWWDGSASRTMTLNALAERIGSSNALRPGVSFYGNNGIAFSGRLAHLGYHAGFTQVALTIAGGENVDRGTLRLPSLGSTYVRDGTDATDLRIWRHFYTGGQNVVVLGKDANASGDSGPDVMRVRALSELSIDFAATQTPAIQITAPGFGVVFPATAVATAYQIGSDHSNTTAATGGATEQASPGAQFSGQYWDGAASRTGLWMLSARKYSAAAESEFTIAGANAGTSSYQKAFTVRVQTAWPVAELPLGGNGAWLKFGTDSAGAGSLFGAAAGYLDATTVLRLEARQQLWLGSATFTGAVFDSSGAVSILGSAGQAATLSANAPTTATAGGAALVKGGPGGTGNQNGGDATLAGGNKSGSGTNGAAVMTDAAGTQLVKVNDTGTTIKKIITATLAGEVDNGNSGASITIDWTLGLCQKLTLTAACTIAFGAPAGACQLQLKLIQDSTGSRTVTWPSMKWAGGGPPTLTTTATTGTDIITVYYDGTAYWGVASLGFA